MAAYLWIVPALPLGAAAVLALASERQRRLAARLAIGAMALAFAFSCAAFVQTLGAEGNEVTNIDWFTAGTLDVRIGWVLDPLSALMLVMVTFVGGLIFIYSAGYMAEDGNFTKFFCFLSLFASAMLGLVISNSLLLLFLCWELVGVASYLLIGFWFQKPSAAAAAKKAFITTRIGDIGFLLGMVWLYAEAGTLLFYDNGNGCLEQGIISALAVKGTVAGMTVATGIGLLLFCGAAGKSGQVPLHVWLPDAMEGPTPVSALIHAATMVAAGVFLIARIYPLMDADPRGIEGESTALAVVTWVGCITAVFAALIAVAQTDIKRILAYSTVSQLGFMMMGLGMGGVAVGMFHLITHAFFKALLFLGAGSAIHGCGGEQDIRRMGGLKNSMRITFATYAAGMMALAGVPLFAGFWSKDEILHAAHGWPVSSLPFYLGLFGAFLTAFYMTRQMFYVFFGSYRGGGHAPHESPRIMTAPLQVLAVFAVALGFLGTPAWPWFQAYLRGGAAALDWVKLVQWEVLGLMLVSSAVVLAGIGLGWRLYGRKAETTQEVDPIERAVPGVYRVLQNRFYVDEFYSKTVIPLHARWGRLGSWLDRWVFGGMVLAVQFMTLAASWMNRLIDEFIINGGFNRACERVRQTGAWGRRLQSGQVQRYLQVLALGLVLLVLLMSWGGGR